jgi:hypothetical protein
MRVISRLRVGRFRRPAYVARYSQHAEARELNNWHSGIGILLGLEPNIADDCQVCRHLLFDLKNASGSKIREETDVHEHDSNELFSTWWLMRYQGPGVFRGQAVEC